MTELPAAAFSIGGLVLAPILLTERRDWIRTEPGIVLVLYLGVVTMAIANILDTRGINGLPLGPVTTLLLADPTTASLLGVLVLGETINGVAAVGLVLVLVGLLMQTQSIGDIAAAVSG